MGAAPVREEIPPHGGRADTQRAQHAQQRSDADQVAAETHLRTRNEDALLAVGTNISATPASKPRSAQFMPGGAKLNVMWCDPAGTVTAWNSPSALWIAVGRPSISALQPGNQVSRRTSVVRRRQTIQALSRSPEVT